MEISEGDGMLLDESQQTSLVQLTWMWETSHRIEVLKNIWTQPAESHIHRVDGDRRSQPRKDSRTCLSGLSRLRSTSATDCQVPRASDPATMGSTVNGATNAGSTCERP